MVKDIGLSLSDIRGEERREIHISTPKDIISRLKRIIPFCDNPDKEREIVYSKTDGLGIDEVSRWMIMDDERQEIKNEVMEKAKREEERKQ